MKTRLLVAVPSLGEPWEELNKTINDLRIQDLDMHLDLVVVCNPSDPVVEALRGRDDVDAVVETPLTRENALVRILETWMASRASHLTWQPAGSTRPEGALREQLRSHTAGPLTASYGSLVSVRDGFEMHFAPRDFDPDMVGLNCYPVETLVVERGPFLQAGGFDNPFAAAYRPNVYLSTMAALSGRVGRIDRVLLRTPDDPVLVDQRDIPSAPDVTGREMWRRMRFDHFVRRARQYARSNWK